MLLKDATHQQAEGFKEFFKGLYEVPAELFRDGSKLFTSGKKDEHGLPELYMAHPHTVPEVVPNPKDQTPFVTGRDIPVITRVPVNQVNELIATGVVNKHDIDVNSYAG